MDLAGSHVWKREQSPPLSHPAPRAPNLLLSSLCGGLCPSFACTRRLGKKEHLLSTVAVCILKQAFIKLLVYAVVWVFNLSYLIKCLWTVVVVVVANCNQL